MSFVGRSWTALSSPSDEPVRIVECEEGYKEGRAQSASIEDGWLETGLFGDQGRKSTILPWHSIDAVAPPFVSIEY